MGWFSKSKSNEQFAWVDLISEEQLQQAMELDCVFIFKHSTRCSISKMVKSKFERDWKSSNKQLQLLYLDLLSYRSISNQIAELTGVEHQSPQLIVLQKGKVVYAASHNAISAEESLKSIVHS